MSFRLFFILSVSAALLIGLWSGYQLSGQKAIREYIMEQRRERGVEIKDLRKEIESLERQLEKSYSRKESEIRLASQAAEATEDPASATDSLTDKADAEMRARAEQEEQLFRDPQGRELVASILEVLPDGFMIRRNADQAEMKLSLHLLSEEDQAFHRYMLENKAAEKEEDEGAWGDVNWDELFK